MILCRSLNGIRMNAMNLDSVAIGDTILAPLYLTLCDQSRAWRSFGWDALNRLCERGLIGDPINNAIPVILTDDRLRDSETLFKQHVVTADSHPSRRGGVKAQRIWAFREAVGVADRGADHQPRAVLHQHVPVVAQDHRGALDYEHDLHNARPSAPVLHGAQVNILLA